MPNSIARIVERGCPIIANISSSFEISSTTWRSKLAPRRLDLRWDAS
jgi:hypothetical protein